MGRRAYSIMIYGNGSLAGFLLKEMTLGFDVAAHELARRHQPDPDLEYKNESGVPTGDVRHHGRDGRGLGRRRGGAAGPPTTYAPTDKTWKIGEGSGRPVLADPRRLRCAASNPTIDMTAKTSRRALASAWMTTAAYLNSGIANLAFYLMSRGGSHRA